MVGNVGESLAAFVSLCASASMAMTPPLVANADPSWRGVDRLDILAQLSGPIDENFPADGFCERVRRIAAEGAPVPVRCVSIGEAMAAEGSASALVVVQGAIQPLGGERVLIVAARRTASAGLEPGPLYLGAAPRAARLAGPAAATDEAEAALRGALTEILPWLGHDRMNETHE
ncbi:hypothetical protein [Sphingosinicella terrae]|uniref:hypothetical protein n=1 Tax=Sphingosinicella terrae TaxID=2172047 RepID=UPI000E0DB310|nr:hypothetical protein [Sphingosinicella terrae]